MRVRPAGPVFRSFKAAGWPLAAAALTLWVTAGTAPPPAHAWGPPGTGPSETSGPRGGDFGSGGNFGGGSGGGGGYSGGGGGGGGYSGGGNSGGDSGNSGGSGGSGGSGYSGGNPGSGSGSGGNTPSYHGNGGNGHHNGGNGHGGTNHHDGHPGGGGHGHGGYRYPTFWGSVFFGWPFPYWYYGPWGFYYEDDYYGNYRDREREQGALDLDLSPADTKVYLNGQYIGIVDNFDGWPQYLWLDPGTYDIVFYREGYKTLARQVTIYRGLVIDWDDKLEKGPSIRPEDLETKTHERRDARIEQDREMRDRQDRREERAPDGEARSARLRLAIEPHDASVYLDGRFLGTGDDVARGAGLWVEPGPHTLSVVRPGRRAEEQRFDLKPGGEVEIRIELKSE